MKRLAQILLIVLAVTALVGAFAFTASAETQPVIEVYDVEGGNPVASAGALNVIERIDDALLAEVQAKSDYIFSALEGAEGIEAVSGMGLMIGIKTTKPAKDVLMACMEQGVLCLTAKDKLRLLPALNIPMEHLETAIAVIKTACK